MDTILTLGITGCIETAADGVVAGWAFDPRSSEPIVLRLVIDGAEIADARCDSSRLDILAAGLGREHVGFHFEIPATFCDDRTHVVQLRSIHDEPIVFRNGDGFERAEWAVVVPKDTVIGQLDEWLGRDIHCWAIVADRVTGTKTPADYIVIQQHGQDVATLLPTIGRRDVAKRYGCQALCGFVFTYDRLLELDDPAPLHFYSLPDGREILGSPIDISAAILARKPSATDRPAPPRTKARPASADVAPPPDAIAAPPQDQTAEETPREGDAAQIAALAASGLFDEAYYLKSYPDMADANIPLFEHFFKFGFREGRWPNLYFDPAWYVENNPEVRNSRLQPLLHFFLEGDRLGLKPGPLFDTGWYRKRYGIAEGENTLAHYLRYRFETPLSPLPDFDADYYAEKYPDVFAAKVDMFEHFFTYGYQECRNPSADFDVKFYVQRYLRGDFSTNPLIHFWAHRGESGIFGRPPEDEVTIPRELKKFCRPGPFFEDVQTGAASFAPQAMLLTYYLPQFHAFPENDAWWGTGFTEWTNVVRGSPRFVGHYQPRVPRDLGFYTLDNVEPMRRQIEMAKNGGVGGFVFYYYWFNGKRLMDQPVWRFLADKTLDIKFSLMWANENWTRRWDGAESEVLISQDYRPDDDRAMAAEFAEHFRDPRYIRLQGRPLLMIYRAGIIPDTTKAIERWREMFRKDFNEDPIFVMAQAFNAENPKDYGFDGAIEFPPHKLTTHMIPVNSEFTYLDAEFSGTIHRYDDVVAISLKDPHPDFPLIKTAVPSWDNDARRQGTGLVITGSTPPKYEAWLSRLVEIAKANPFFGEPIVCVNAWNEWCEGAYLEPDLHFGAAYLNATARAVAGRGRRSAIPRLVLVGHDAFPSGAQHLLLNIGRVLKSDFGIEFEYVLLGGGAMTEHYSAQGKLTVVSSDAQLTEKLRALAEAGFTGAIVNTSASGRAVSYLRTVDIRPIILIHELPRILREKQLSATAKQGLTEAEQIVFSAPFVRDAVMTELDLPLDERVRILPQGSYKDIHFDAEGRARVRQEFGLTDDDHMILGVGYADLRKGFDLFLQISRLLQTGKGRSRKQGRICLVWVGGIDPALKDWLGQEMAEAEAAGTFKMAGYRNDMQDLFSASSVFALTSREDPLPTVVMEALGAGVPVVAFEGSGGIPDLLEQIDEGSVVSYGDTGAMADAIRTYIAEGIALEQREQRHAKIAKHYHFPNYVRELMNLALPDLARVSVAVPNYNYAQYMPSRLGTVFEQTYPVQEILVLDDCSKDDSLAVIPKVAEEASRSVRMVVNETNSGSVFVQWRRAAEMAAGDYVWIAEADDLSDPDFLASATQLLTADPSVQLAFCDSRTVDAEGNPQWESYKGYYATVEPGALRETTIFDAEEFVCRFLSVKNLILNVSAVVWRRDALCRALDACAADLKEFKMAGDWLLYLTALSVPGAKIGYEERPLNVHRRHATSVTHALNADRHVAEIARCHDFAARTFKLPVPAKKKQTDYLAEVAKQLGASALPEVKRGKKEKTRQRTRKP